MTMTSDTTIELTAGKVMTRKFVAVAPEDTLGEVAQKLSAADAGSALVVDYGRLIGILTSRDVIHAIAERVHPSEARVREWMSAEPTTVAPDTPADEAARAMLAGGFHHLPVTEEGRPLGLIGLRAVIGALRPWSPGF
jgi:CBS domain-containing protein